METRILLFLWFPGVGGGKWGRGWQGGVRVEGVPWECRGLARLGRWEQEVGR